MNPILEKYFWPVVTLFAGSIFTYIITKISNKIKKFTYTYEINRVALSTKDVRFGDIQVTWQGENVPNLYLATFHLENSSYSDFENVDLRIWCGPSTKLLQDRISMVDSTFEINYSPEFQNKTFVPVNQEPTEGQRSLYWGTRDYLIPVFNRGQKVNQQVLFLSEENDPMVYMEIKKKGIKLNCQPPQQHIFGIPIITLLPWTIISSILLTIVLILGIRNNWVMGLMALFIGLFGQFWGVGLFKVVRFFRNKVSF